MTSDIKFEVIDGIAFTYVNGVKGVLNPNDAKVLVEHAKNLPKNAKYLEIGSYLGCSAHLIALHSDATIWCHDIWKEKWEDNKDASDKECIRTEDFFYVFYDNVKKNNMQNRIIPIRGDSKYTVGIHDRESIDLAFIDGDHTYEGVLADFRNVLPLVKKGGIILAHDCQVNTEPLEALKQFTSENNLNYTIFPGTTGMAKIFV